MIVAHVSDPYLRKIVRSAAHAEEDVVLDSRLSPAAVEWGFPRLVVHQDGTGLPLVGVRSGIPILRLDRQLLSRWEAERTEHEVPPARTEFLAARLRHEIDKQAQGSSWVDKCLADLSKAAGHPLPQPLRAFGRRILEFPSHYTDLHAMAGVCDLTRGALKARFRRRGLESPYTYLRWFRMLAVAYMLSDRSVTVATAAHRLGFTSDGNLCRAMVSLTGLTPTEVRTVRGWNRLLIGFAWTYLTTEQLERWVELDDLFGRDVA